MTGTVIRIPSAKTTCSAYVDDRLPEERRRAVIRHMEANPAVRARIQADKAARDWLRQRLSQIDELTVPDRLRVDTIIGRRRSALPPPSRSPLAASVALVAGRRRRRLDGPRSCRQPGFRPASMSRWHRTAADAISAHRIYVVETAHPVEVGAAQEQHLVQWLSRRLKHKLIAPDLARQGYAADGRAAAARRQRGSGAVHVRERPQARG